MEITEVRVFLRNKNDNDKLRAYATITFDDSFVIRNLKIIEGNKGLFVAMPSRKVKEPCSKCGFKNETRSKFCNHCGQVFEGHHRTFTSDDDLERQSEYRDIAHPITLECREYLQSKVIEAYERELSKTGTSVL